MHVWCPVYRDTLDEFAGAICVYTDEADLVVGGVDGATNGEEADHVLSAGLRQRVRGRTKISKNVH